MTIQLTTQQSEMLKELLEAAHRDTVHELHRTSALGYKKLLREKIALIEAICESLASSETVAS